MTETRDLRIERVEPLPAPEVIARELPAPDAATELVARSRATVRDIVAGRDSRWLAIVGPCSIHDPEAAREYGARRAALAISGHGIHQEDQVASADARAALAELHQPGERRVARRLAVQRRFAQAHHGCSRGHRQ